MFVCVFFSCVWFFRLFDILLFSFFCRLVFSFAIASFLNFNSFAYSRINKAFVFNISGFYFFLSLFFVALYSMDVYIMYVLFFSIMFRFFSATALSWYNTLFFLSFFHSLILISMSRFYLSTLLWSACWLCEMYLRTDYWITISFCCSLAFIRKRFSSLKALRYLNIETHSRHFLCYFSVGGTFLHWFFFLFHR